MRPSKHRRPLRGDVNGDGEVSISDSHALFALLNNGLASLPGLPDCPDAWDFDADGLANWRDAGIILEFLFRRGRPPAQPFPEAGPARPLFGCAESGSGEPLDDPQATLEILSAEGEAGEAIIVLGASHSWPIAGHSFDLRLPRGVLVGLPTREVDLADVFVGGFAGGRMDFNTYTHGFLPSYGGGASILPSDDVVPIYELWFDLRQDVAAGDYPIDLEVGELIDLQSGRAIKPKLVSGTLTVPGAPGDERLQRPGDCNGDGTLNITDGICLLGHLFEGNPSLLPCGDGTLEIPGNTSLLDSNGDGSVNLADAVSVFGFLFGGAPPPVLGTECVKISGCPAMCGG